MKIIFQSSHLTNLITKTIKMLQFFLYNFLATFENSDIRLEQLIIKNYTDLVKFLKKLTFSDFKYG